MADEGKPAEPTNKSSTTFYDLMAMVINSPGTPDEKSKLIKQLQSANPASEKALFLTVVSILGLVAFASVIAGWQSDKASDFLPIVTGCIGALSGMLASRSQSGGPPPSPPAPTAGSAEH